MEILFLISDHQKTPFTVGNYNNKQRFIECAVKTGAKVIVSTWNNIHIKDNAVFVRNGIFKDQKSETEITNPIKLNPNYINLHINDPAKQIIIYEKNIDIFNYLLKNSLVANSELSQESITKKYLSHLLENFWQKARISYQYDIVMMGKWYLEKYLKEAEENNIKVKRPFTIIQPKKEMVNSIIEIFEKNPTSLLIAKPHSQTCGTGIKLISNKNKKAKIEEILSENEEFYVLQEYIADTQLYKNRKTDLRIYVGIFSWQPLKFKVYAHGLTRISNHTFDPKNFEDQNSSITTMSLLNKHLEHNITIEEYLDSISHIHNDRIWKKIHTEVEKTLKAILKGSKINPKTLKNVIYLLGFDVILKGKKCDPYILEINHFPTIYRGKENDPQDKVNSKLDQSYIEFFKDIKKHCSI